MMSLVSSKRQDHLSVGLDALRAAVAPQRTRLGVALLALELPPPTGARGAHPEPQRRLAPRHPAGDRRQNPFPQIQR